MTLVTKASAPADVDEYMARLTHPMAKVLAALRRVILGAHREIGEEIKWNAPTFFYAGKMKPSDPKKYERYLVVSNLFRKDCIRLVFWGGGRVKNHSGLLEGDDAETNSEGADQDARQVAFPALETEPMPSASSSRYLSPALTVVGLSFLVGLYPLTIYWPSGWSWLPPQPAYLQMIIGVYATLGVFLLLAARDPLRHRSLIWFTVWSSVVHAGVMAYHALNDPTQRGHLYGDVAVLLLVAVVLGVLMPRESAV